MRILGFALYKVTEFVANTYHAINMQNIETWLMNAYVRWWPFVMRLFQ